MKRHSYEYVYNFFKDQGCELLSKKYTGNRQLLDFICSCGNKSQIKFHEFRIGQRCNKCKIKRIAEKQKLSYKEIYDYFKSQGCELLSEEYINAKIKMKYKCNCGNISEISYDNFKQGRRCEKCRYKRMAKNRKKYTYKFVKNIFDQNNCILLTNKNEYDNGVKKLDYICVCGNNSKITFYDYYIKNHRCRNCCGTERHSYKYVYNYFKEHGCELLENEYKNNRIPMKYKCSCGNISQICFGSFKAGNRCKKCGDEKTHDKQRFSYEFVKETFDKNDCILLSKKYINCKQKLKYICSCGNKHEISFDNFIQGKRCPVCSESKGEKVTRCVLEKYNLNYKPQYTFDDLRRIELLRFDFGVLNKHDNLICLIEYDGEYHYLPIESEEKLKYQQENDDMKNLYCKKNNIFLLRIPYWDFDNIENIVVNYINDLGVKLSVVDAEV